MAVTYCCGVSTGRLPEHGQAAWRDSRLDAEYLELELTESVLLSNAEVTPIILRELKAMGVKLAIDDCNWLFRSQPFCGSFRLTSSKLTGHLSRK